MIGTVHSGITSAQVFDYFIGPALVLGGAFMGRAIVRYLKRIAENSAMVPELRREQQAHDAQADQRYNDVLKALELGVQRFDGIDRRFAAHETVITRIADKQGIPVSFPTITAPTSTGSPLFSMHATGGE